MNSSPASPEYSPPWLGHTYYQMSAPEQLADKPEKAGPKLVFSFKVHEILTLTQGA
jgi:uncharacterized protein YecE (DUF72 family)